MQKDKLIREDAILIGVGANLSTAEHGPPLQSCKAALDAMAASGLTIVQVSPWYEGEPVPASDQPWYVNGVVAIATEKTPADVMSSLHDIEAAFGRRRHARNEARVLDLDLLAYGRYVSDLYSWPSLPHPRLGERAFVLLPLSDVAPGWRHPSNGQSVDDLIDALAVGQVIRRIANSST